MKKWLIVLVICLAAFCVFFCMNSFCQFTSHNIVKAYMLFGVELFGLVIPWYVITALTVLSLTMMILSLIQVVRSSKKHLCLLMLILPVMLIAIVSQETEEEFFFVPQSGVVSADGEHFQSIEINEDTNDVLLSNWTSGGSGGTQEPVLLHLSASTISKVDMYSRLAAITFITRENKLYPGKRVIVMMAMNKPLENNSLRQTKDYETGNLILRIR